MKLSILLIALILSFFLIRQNQHLSSSLPKETVEDYSNQVIATCSKQEYPPSCYNQEIPKLMDPPINISMEDAFKVVDIVQQRDSSLGFCHFLAHKLSAKEQAENPDWLNIIPRCPVNGMCTNGCLHGTLQERFRNEVLSDEQIETLKPDLAIACERRDDWNPTGFEQQDCYHGFGHLSLYITGANFKKALEICDSIALKNDYEYMPTICYEGVFMQLFIRLEPEDEALVKGKVPTKETLREFCLKFNGVDQVEACWMSGWPLFKEELKNASGIVKFCTTPSDTRKQNRCFSLMSNTMAQRLNFDTGKIVALCNKIPEEKQGRCFAYAALSMTNEDKMFIETATKLCSFAKTKRGLDECYRILLKHSSYNFHKGSSEFIEFCNSLIEPWRSDCLK